MVSDAHRGRGLGAKRAQWMVRAGTGTRGTWFTRDDNRSGSRRHCSEKREWRGSERGGGQRIKRAQERRWELVLRRRALGALVLGLLVVTNVALSHVSTTKRRGNNFPVSNASPEPREPKRTTVKNAKKLASEGA